MTNCQKNFGQLINGGTTVRGFLRATDGMIYRIGLSYGQRYRTNQLFPSLKIRAMQRKRYCVHEAVKLAHGVSTRSPRLAPDIELKYGPWVIPWNTPVSMINIDILMNEIIFPKSRAFIPERWINDPNLDRYLVSFGKGSRACLGIK